MKVVCDNCRSAYRVPDEKLQKPINKAVCRGCGFRLMIPRPKPGHDPNERTLVSAVPPKKSGAPRSAPARSDPGPRRAPSQAPGRPPEPPLPSDGSLIDPETRPIGDEVAPMGSMAPGELPSAAAPETPTAVRTPSFPSAPSSPRNPSAPRHPSRPSLPPRRPAPSMAPGVRSPSQPSLDRRSVAPSRARAAGPRSGTDSRSAPAADSRVGQPAVAHNPATNYIWTLIGLGMAGVGFIISVVASLLEGADQPVVVFAGSGMLVAGLLLAGLITLSGRNGRRPAKVFRSLATSSAMGGFVAFTVVSARFALDSNHVWARTPPPLPPPTPADDDDEPDTTNPTGLPVEAVRPLVENNLEVKGCFVPLFRDNMLPPRVDVAFTVSPEGRANDIALTAPERWVDSWLETCLAKAIRDIEFPKSKGKGTSFVYPLVIR